MSNTGFHAKHGLSVLNSTAFVVNSTTGYVGVGTSAPAVEMDIRGTGASRVPQGNTSQRPTGANGMFRYNTESGLNEVYGNGAWNSIGFVATTPGSNTGVVFNDSGALNTSPLFVFVTNTLTIGNSTVNAAVNATTIVTDTGRFRQSVNVGGAWFSNTGWFIGNSTINTTANSSVLQIGTGTFIFNGVTANGIGNTAGKLVQVGVDGKLPPIDASLLTGLNNGVLLSIKVYTSSTTWTRTEGAKRAVAWIIGAGGGSGGPNGTGGTGGTSSIFGSTATGGTGGSFSFPGPVSGTNGSASSMTVSAPGAGGYLLGFQFGYSTRGYPGVGGDNDGQNGSGGFGAAGILSIDVTSISSNVVTIGAAGAAGAFNGVIGNPGLVVVAEYG